MLSFPRRQSTVPDDGPAKLNFGLSAPVNVATFIRYHGVVHSTPLREHFHSRLWSIDHPQLLCVDMEFLCISFRGLSQHLDDFEEALFDGGGGRKRKIKFRCQRF